MRTEAEIERAIIKHLNEKDDMIKIQADLRKYLEFYRRSPVGSFDLSLKQ